MREEEHVLPERNPADEMSAPAQNASGPATPGQADFDLLTLILTSLEDDKAEDVVSIALKGKSEIADHMVVASGRSSRQVQSIAEKLADRVKQATGTPVRMEGRDAGDWVLIDCGDAIVHLFRPEVREFYQLEKMWLPAKEQLSRAPVDA